MKAVIIAVASVGLLAGISFMKRDAPRTEERQEWDSIVSAYKVTRVRASIVIGDIARAAVERDADSSGFHEWLDSVEWDLDEIERRLHEAPAENPVDLKRLKNRCQELFAMIQRTAEVTPGVEVERDRFKYNDLGFTDAQLWRRYPENYRDDG